MLTAQSFILAPAMSCRALELFDNTGDIHDSETRRSIRQDSLDGQRARCAAVEE